MGAHVPEPTLTVLDPHGQDWSDTDSDDSDDSDDRQGDDSDEDLDSDDDGSLHRALDLAATEAEEDALRTLLWVAAAANNVPLMALLCALAHPDALENVECEIQAPTVQFGREFMARARNPLLVALSQECPRMRKVLCAYAPRQLNHPLARPMVIAALLDAARRGDLPSLRYYHAAWLPFHAASDEWDDRFRECFTRDILEAAARAPCNQRRVLAYLRDAMGISDRLPHPFD